MPIWLTKKLPPSKWGAIQFRASLLESEAGTRLHFAMLVKRRPLGEPDDVFILLPDDGLTAHFPGFATIDATALPDGLRMLIGSEAAIAKRFPELAPKLMLMDA